MDLERTAAVLGVFLVLLILILIGRKRYPILAPAKLPEDAPAKLPDEDALFKSVVENNTCPDCKHTGFYSGPEGGMMTNIFCKNVNCRSGFNVCSFSTTQGICQRIGKGDIDRYPDKDQYKPAKAACSTCHDPECRD